MTVFAEETARSISALAAKPAAEISNADIAIALDALRGDHRVRHLEFSRREIGGRPLFNIVATDTTAGPGEFAGEFSLGRIIATLSERWMPHARRLEEKWEAEAEMRARIRDREHARRLEKEGNERKLREAGITVERLCRISNSLYRGSHMPDSDMEAWLFYEREIVRGREKSMKLDLYLPDVQSSLH